MHALLQLFSCSLLFFTSLWYNFLLYTVQSLCSVFCLTSVFSFVSEISLQLFFYFLILYSLCILSRSSLGTSFWRVFPYCFLLQSLFNFYIPPHITDFFFSHSWPFSLHILYEVPETPVQPSSYNLRISLLYSAFSVFHLISLMLLHSLPSVSANPLSFPSSTFSTFRNPLCDRSYIINSCVLMELNIPDIGNHIQILGMNLLDQTFRVHIGEHEGPWLVCCKRYFW